MRYIFVFGGLTFLFIVMIFELKTENKQIVKQHHINQTYQQDSLCRVWVDSTHLRVAFKTWYNTHKGKTK